MLTLFECKACGGELDIVGEGVGRCVYCGSKQPIPKNNEVIFNRANKLRLENKDFEEANKVYKEILKDSPNDSEVYWGMLLCRYGIEYVKDNDGKYLPTCHRTVMTSIVDDVDLNSALSNADEESFKYYKEQAILIDKYQQEIKKIVANEKPYDVFISFKAKDETGFPTRDAMLAQKIYNYLSKELKLKVFFSNVTLQDRAGEEFEPIIFAALQSSKVMVLVGTTQENINSTWVKNEWSRYIKMVSEASNTGKKKRFIPALLNMKPEELPSELSCFQAMDMSIPLSIDKLGNSIDMFIGDEKIKNIVTPEFSTKKVSNDLLNKQALNLLELANQKLKRNSYDEAISLYSKALENNIKLSDAYWGMLLAKENVSSTEELATKGIKHIEEKSEFEHAVKYASPEKKELYNSFITICNKNYMVDLYQKRYNRKIEEASKTYRTFDRNVKVTEKSSSIIEKYFYFLKGKENIVEKHTLAEQQKTKYSNKKLIIRTILFVIFVITEWFMCSQMNDLFSENKSLFIDTQKENSTNEQTTSLKDESTETSADEQTIKPTDEQTDNSPDKEEALVAIFLSFGVVIVEPILILVFGILFIRCLVKNINATIKEKHYNKEYQKTYQNLYNTIQLLAEDSVEYITNFNLRFEKDFKYRQDILFVKSTYIKEEIFKEENIHQKIIKDITKVQLV